MSPFVALVRGVIAAGPDEFRKRYGTEILETLQIALAVERRERGGLAMARLGVRSVLDAVGAVRRERSLIDRRGGVMTDWLGDLRAVLRGWRKAPGFTATLVLTLVLGLGLTSAIFAFADGYLFRPTPFPNADRLYFVLDRNSAITGMVHASDQDALRRSAIADFGFVEWSVSRRPVSGEILIGDRRVEIFAYGVSPGFRKIVQLPLLAGRDFSDDDHREGGEVAAWLTHRYWQREFGGDWSVIGRSYAIRQPAGGSARIVVAGILGPEATSFDLNNEPPDIVVADVPVTTFGPNFYAMPIVALPDGMSAGQGEARIASVLQGAAPASDGKPRAVRLLSLHESQVRGGRPTARVLFAGALLVLGLASINLVHLLLTRGVSRAGEIAMRAALGASRWRLTRLFLTESLVLAAVGIAGGLLLGSWLSNLIEARIPRLPTGGRNMALVPMLFDWRVVVFTVVLGLSVALVGGLWPARRAMRRSLALSGRSAGGVVSAISGRLSRSILASELAVATVVMLGTLFIGLGIWRYLHQPLGFEYANRYYVTVTRDGGQMVTPAEAETAVRVMRDVPGVKAAGIHRLFSVRGAIEVPGRAVNTKPFGASSATEGYFEAWGLQLRRGRWFTPQEFAGSGPVAVVDLKMAQAVWPDADPVGQDIQIASVLRRVIGVIEPQRQSLSREGGGQAYVPVSQVTRWTSAVAWAPGVSLAEMQRRAQVAVTAAVPGTEVRVEAASLDKLFMREVGEAQFQAPIMFVFGVLAFLLAGIGVFGLVSYLVEQRTREFGIRFALGARPLDVWRSVIRQSVNPAIIGLVIGVGAAWALESVVRSSVFGWQSSGPGAVLTVAVALLTVAVLAAAAPARRAMRVDPAITLRTE
jgi:putative ABC transport system permease protein